MNAASIAQRSAPRPAAAVPAPSTANADGTLYALQYLRGLAALAIVIYHICRFRGFAVAMEGTWLKAMTDAGAPAAVDLFFALSGFLMVYTQAAKPKAADEFFRRRAFRIVPVYWFMTLAWFALMAVTASPEHPNPFSPLHLVTSLLFCSQFFGFQFPLLLPGWSLEYEMIFYAIMALAIWRRGAGFAGLTCAAVVALVGAQALRPICLEFVMGMVAGIMFPRRLPPRFALPALIVALAVFGYGSTMLHDRVEGDWWRVLFWGLPMFVLLLNGLNMRQVRIPPLLFLAECSYSIYVTHHVSIYVFAKLANMGLINTGWGWLGVVCCFTFCIGTGILIHHLIERTADDVLRGRKHWGWKLPRRAGMAGMPAAA